MSRRAEEGGLDRLKEEARRRADALRLEYAQAGDPMAWFDALYRQAEGQAALVPWAHEVARPEFVEWLDALPRERRTGRALDVGCGLGDNSVLLAEAGFDVTAFDVSETAVAWARKRFPGHEIDWRVADLCDPPASFEAAFDLVNETYTLQALRPPHRDAAIRVLARFVKPGGTLLVVGRGRLPEEPENPPPWPLLREELEPLQEAGLEEISFEDFHTERKGRLVRHFRAEYGRP